MLHTLMRVFSQLHKQALSFYLLILAVGIYQEHTTQYTDR